MDEAMFPLTIYNRALNEYGIKAQEYVLIEECGELLDALAKLKRGRVEVKDLITELADVSIMCEQIGYFYGWEEFVAEKERKLLRLKERLEK